MEMNKTWFQTQGTYKLMEDANKKIKTFGVVA
jgi:hypothetical protein